MKRDITGEATQRLRSRMKTLRERMADRIPTGPTQATLTPREIRMELQKMDPAKKTAIMRQAGPEEWNRLMETLYSV